MRKTLRTWGQLEKPSIGTSPVVMGKKISLAGCRKRNISIVVLLNKANVNICSLMIVFIVSFQLFRNVE